MTNISLLTSYVSIRARKLFGKAKAYDVNAASSLWFVSPKVPTNEFAHWNHESIALTTKYSNSKQKLID